MSAASGGSSEPKQGQRSQSARGFCPRSTMRVPQPDIIEHFGNADAVPQLPERCLSRKAGIVRCCLLNMYISRPVAGLCLPFYTYFDCNCPAPPCQASGVFSIGCAVLFSNFLCFLAFVLSAGPFLCCFSDFSVYAVLFISLLQPICTKLSHKTVNLHTSAQNFCATF